MMAIQQKGDALYYASKELKSDREVVLLAVHNSGQALPLQYASNELKSDREIAMMAFRKNG